jgi:hypothetical protein
MNTVRIGADSATLELTRHELATLNNALNETCNGMGLEGEFETRMGATEEEAARLLQSLHAVLGKFQD